MATEAKIAELLLRAEQRNPNDKLPVAEAARFARSVAAQYQETLRSFQDKRREALMDPVGRYFENVPKVVWDPAIDAAPANPYAVDEAMRYVSSTGVGSSVAERDALAAAEGGYVVPRLVPKQTPKNSSKAAWSSTALRALQQDVSTYDADTAQLFEGVAGALTRVMKRPVAERELVFNVNYGSPVRGNTRQLSVMVEAPVLCRLAVTQRIVENGQMLWDVDVFGMQGIDSLQLRGNKSPPTRVETPAPAAPAPVTSAVDVKRRRTITI